MDTMRNNGSPPFGYKRVDGKLVPDENYCILINISLFVTAGYSLQKVADRLNEEGVRGPRGGKWTRQYISRLLKANPHSEE